MQVAQPLVWLLLVVVVVVKLSWKSELLEMETLYLQTLYGHWNVQMHIIHIELWKNTFVISNSVPR